MLVSADNRAIDIVRGPVELPGGVSLLLDSGQEAVPQAGPAPAIEPAGDRAPGAIPLGEVTPRGARAEEPQHPVENPAMIGRRAAGRRFLGGKQRLESLPLLVG